MQQFLYWRMQVLLLCGGHQKVIDVVGNGTQLLLNNRRWELVLNHSRAQGHVISPSLHGWHLSSNLRTFLARLIVPFSSSELDLRATAHIQRCGQTPRRYGVYLIKMLFTANHGSAAPTGPWRGPHRRVGRAKYLVKQFRVIGNHSEGCR
jgi:hypothetical protein